MEFINYLTPPAKEILNMVRLANFQVIENSSKCKNKSIFGWQESKIVIICTNNIVKHGQPHIYITETLLHEAVHVAQSCKGGSFHISKKLMPLPPEKLVDVKKSNSLSNSSSATEHEAHWMENKPEKVKYVLNKFCF